MKALFKCLYCGHRLLHTVEKGDLASFECPVCGGRMEMPKQIENMEVSSSPLYPPLSRVIIDTVYSSSINFDPNHMWFLNLLG